MNGSKNIFIIALAFLTFTLLATEVSGHVNQGYAGNSSSNFFQSPGQQQSISDNSALAATADALNTAPKGNDNIFKQIDERLNLKPAEEVIQLPARPLPSASPTVQEENSQALKNENSIEWVIQKQLADLRELDISKAYYAYMSTDFQKVYSVDVFKAFVRKNPTLFRNKTFSSEGSTFHDIVAQVNARLVSTDGQIAQVQYDLVQEDGVWKIRKIDLITIKQPPRLPKNTPSQNSK